ncbi:phthalate 4,5-dioxygenase oxygenase subunit [Paraburkholderia youngii]|uniref:Aromatic ring-hydroxylating dioxygenase subunit alpha n=1 Tax=Paraburkholderia youngii TaxID=2782701 RepID=A0ABX2NDD3_9BURK|nr:aromatic ring-hydroxylating dioxygenase subunit alpha [Paraburkholderia youngii]NVI02328.1 aromatic ring-hydroxylating dioxygenase subunit alpha [Paraburkholderia youngii]
MTKDENELLTRVSGDAPMGQMIRQNWWIPALRSASLVASGRPERVRLFGQNFVAFRGDNGKVGFFDEACPHRGASLALARNEDNALRCIFHGWKFNSEGVTVAVPTQPNNEAEYCKHVPLRHYPTQEAGGIAWVYLGQGEAPKFADLPFVGLPADQVVVHRQRLECNWLQAVETTMDSAHVGVLHQSWLEHEMTNASVNQAPVYKIRQKEYGFRYAAVRALGDGRSYVRTNSFVMPWYGMISPRKAGDTTRSQMFFSVPIDDENTWYWHMTFILDKPVPHEDYIFPADRDNWPPVSSRSADDLWGQDREAMKNGHFSGFPQTLGTEDFAILLSMGTLQDRTKEYLGAGDGAVMQVRRCLMNSLTEFSAGSVPKLAQHEKIDYRSVMPLGGVYENDQQWQTTL